MTKRRSKVEGIKPIPTVTRAIDFLYCPVCGSTDLQLSGNISGVEVSGDFDVDDRKTPGEIRCLQCGTNMQEKPSDTPGQLVTRWQTRALARCPACAGRLEIFRGTRNEVMCVDCFLHVSHAALAKYKSDPRFA